MSSEERLIQRRYTQGRTTLRTEKKNIFLRSRRVGNGKEEKKKKSNLINSRRSPRLSFLRFSMCLLSFVYRPIDGSINQYITNDTVGVNDNPGLGRIMLPRKDRSISAAVKRRTSRQRCTKISLSRGGRSTLGAPSTAPTRPPHPAPNNRVRNTFSQRNLSGARRRFAKSAEMRESG